MKRFMTRLAVGVLSLIVATSAFAKAVPPEVWPQLWVSGQAPTGWAADEVYVIECWATWCKPCLAAMPHMEAMHQATKGEGIHIYGVNIESNKTPEEIRTFLAKRETPPTYAMALDTKNTLSQIFGFRGIPFAAVIRNGETVWTGHPEFLTAEALREVRKTGKMSEESRPKPAAPKQPSDLDAVYKQEAEADKAFAEGKMALARSLQRDALLMHPLQKKLPKQYIPAVKAKFEGVADAILPTYLPATNECSDAGDLKPYAELLKQKLPADKALTVISYWRFPFWVDHMTYQNYSNLPGFSEASKIRRPYRTIVVTDADAKRVEKLLRDVPADMRVPQLLSREEIDPELFAVNQNYNGPFLAIFFEGQLIFKGSFEALPSIFLENKTAVATAEDYRKQIGQAQAAAIRAVELYKTLRTCKTPQEQQETLAAIKALPGLSERWVSLLVPYEFGPTYQSKDVEGAAKLYRQMVKQYAMSPDVLSILFKVPQSWPELDELVRPEQSIVAENMGRYDPEDLNLDKRVAWLKVAITLAEKSGDTARAEALTRIAIETLPTNLRWQRFSHVLPALPSK